MPYSYRVVNYSTFVAAATHDKCRMMGGAMKLQKYANN